MAKFIVCTCTVRGKNRALCRMQNDDYVQNEYLVLVPTECM